MIKITNRRQQHIAVVVEEPTVDPVGLAFVMHGLGGFKDQPHVQVSIKELLAAGYTVVSFDTTHTFGESDGDYADATVTTAKADLEDVIAWAATQAWYQEPFVLAGYSLGGMCSLLFAEEHPDQVQSLILFAPCVSGDFSVQAMQKYSPGTLDQWKDSGWLTKPSNSLPGVIKRLKWSHMEDRLKYDALPQADRLTMPVLVVVGSADTSCPVEDQQALYDRLPGERKLEIIEGMPHTPRDEKHLEACRSVVREWLQKAIS